MPTKQPPQSEFLETSHGTTEAEVVAYLAQEGVRLPVIMELTDGPLIASVLLIPEGDTFNLKSVKELLNEYRTEPEYRKGTAVMTDLESFLAHASRFSDTDSVIFANRTPGSPSLTCVHDYHRKTATGAPRFGRHRSHYAFPLSDEWKLWSGRNGKNMSLAEFSEFVESRIADVIAPEHVGPGPRAYAEKLGVQFAGPARLLELSRGLAVHVGASVRQAINTATGEASIAFDEQHDHKDKSGAPVKVPGAFVIGVPVFRAGAPYQMAVRLRYRVQGSAITWFYELYRPDVIFDHAIDEACTKAAEATELPVLSGAPEA